jgi:hypothetical protein
MFSVLETLVFARVRDSKPIPVAQAPYDLRSADPALEGQSCLAHFVKPLVPLVNTDDAAPRSRYVVQVGLGNLEPDAEAL